MDEGSRGTFIKVAGHERQREMSGSVEVDYSSGWEWSHRRRVVVVSSYGNESIDAKRQEEEDEEQRQGSMQGMRLG